MGSNLFKVRSKCLLIYWICWFGLAINSWGFLETSHNTTTANENSANKPYFWGGLFANPADVLRPVDARLIILGIFDLVPYSEYPFSPSRDWIALGALDDFLSEANFISLRYITNYLEHWMFVQRIVGRSLAGRTLFCVLFGLRLNIILSRDDRLVSWNFSWIFLKIWSKPSILEVNILQ